MATDRLQGKTALVTGAARRLGRAIALGFAAAGANVVLHYHTSGDAADELRAVLERSGVRAWTVPADLSDESEALSLVPRALDVAGDLHVLVNSAADFPPVSLDDLQLEDLQHSVQLDAWAPFCLGREFHRLVGRGHIINLIDARVDGYDFRHAGYILAKHALLALTRMQALQYAPGVAVNAILPGLILPPPGQDEAFLDRLTHTVPLQRHGDAADIAAAAIFLARSTFMTGSLIHVDGGRHLQAYDDPSSNPHQ